MIHLITGTAGTGKTKKLLEKIILSSKLHGKQSLIFTEDRIIHRSDLKEMLTDRALPYLQICEMSQEAFLQNVEKEIINPVVPASRTTRIGIDYSNLSPRIVAACHKLSELGYEVWVTCQVMRPGAPKESEFEKLFK